MSISQSTPTDLSGWELTVASNTPKPHNSYSHVNYPLRIVYEKELPLANV